MGVGRGGDQGSQPTGSPPAKGDGTNVVLALHLDGKHHVRTWPCLVEQGFQSSSSLSSRQTNYFPISWRASCHARGNTRLASSRTCLSGAELAFWNYHWPHVAYPFVCLNGPPDPDMHNCNLKTEGPDLPAAQLNRAPYQGRAWYGRLPSTHCFSTTTNGGRRGKRRGYRQ